MKIKRSLWPMAVLGAVVALLADLGFRGANVAEARGGGGGGRGGGGRSGGGRTGGGNNPTNPRTNDKQRQEQQRQRREELRGRIEVARTEYAKRERQLIWNAESDARTASGLNRTLDGATE